MRGCRTKGRGSTWIWTLEATVLYSSWILFTSLLYTQVVSHNMDTETKHLPNNHLPSRLKPKAQSSETGGGCHGNNTHTDHCDGPQDPKYIIIKEAGLEQFKNALCVYPSNCGSWCYFIEPYRTTSIAIYNVVQVSIHILNKVYIQVCQSNCYLLAKLRWTNPDAVPWLTSRQWNCSMWQCTCRFRLVNWNNTAAWLDFRCSVSCSCRLKNRTPRV